MPEGAGSSRMTTDKAQIVERKEAEELFTEYFVRNYPGPATIIGNPHWHAPKIFRAAVHALEASGLLTDLARLKGELERVTAVAENLAGELFDPGTEALAAIHCARAALNITTASQEKGDA